MFKISRLEKPFSLLPRNPASNCHYPVFIWEGDNWVYLPAGIGHCLSARLPNLDGWFPPGGQGDHLKKGPLENDAARHAYEAFYRTVFKINLP